MSALPDSRIVRISEAEERGRMESCTRGFSDRFGDRLLTVDRATATPLELLRFKTELSSSGAFEEGLRERIEHTRVHDPATVPARSVERWDGALVLVSRHVSGRRLSEVMAEERGAAIALDFIRQVVPAVAALSEPSRRFAHGAITLERVVAGHDGRLTVVEHPLGPAVEALGWPTSRLQSELGLVMPENRKSNLFDSRVDVIQIGFVTLSLLLGRRIDAASYPANVPRLLDESAEAKGGETWAASRLRSWLERALQIGPRPVESVREAMNSLGELPSENEFSRRAETQVLLAAPSAASPAVAPVAAAPAPVKPEHKLIAPAKTPVRLAQVVPAKKIEVAQPAAAPAPPVLVARQSTPLVAAVAPAAPVATEIAAAHVSNTPSRRVSAASLALAAVSVIALAEGVVIAGRWLFEPKPAVVESARLAEPAAAAAVPEPPKTAAPERKSAPLQPPPGAIEAAPQKSAPDALAPDAVGGGAAVVSAARRFGGVTLLSPLDLQVFENGTRIGSAGAPIAVLEGVHNLDLVSDTLGYHARETVTVKPGELTSRTVAVPNGRISINAIPWAEVQIDGNPAGQTPLANLSVPIGEHQITFRHPQLGEQRQTAVVKSEGVTRLSATMQK